MLVNEKLLFPKKLILMENKFLISNWSKGLNIVFNLYIINIYIYLYLNLLIIL